VTGLLMPHVSHEDYHRRVLGEASKSGLDQIARSPAHYRAWVEGQRDKSTTALDLGRLVHTAILEPDVFAGRYAEQPDFGDGRTKIAKEAKAEWIADHAGKIGVSAEDWQIVAGVRRGLARHSHAARLFTRGLAEQTVRWTDDETGVKCKCRPDYLRLDAGIVVDLKTCRDVSAFARSVAEYRYHVQEAHYREGIAVATGVQPSHFIFVAVETEAPFACGVFELDAEALEKGRTLVRGNVSRLAECVNTGRWPAYYDDTGIQTLSLPRWAA